MRLAVISCWAYRDAWTPFFALLDKFWADHPAVTLITDHAEPGTPASLPFYVRLFSGPKHETWSWCQMLRAYALTVGDEPILLMQEDFWLVATVDPAAIERALAQLDGVMKAGAVRLYPCPGGDLDYGNAEYAVVPRGTPYRISCQATIWRPSFLLELTQDIDTAFDFEANGTKTADRLPQEVLAFKRDVQPWTIEYLCSAINRGKWNPDARRICDKYGIPVDWSLREFQTA